MRDPAGDADPVLDHGFDALRGAELDALIPADVKADVGSSTTGQYELVAIVTHKGAEADAGHYIGFVKKSALHPTKPLEKAGEKLPPGFLDADDEDWYKFDDDKVSVFPKDKLGTLDGGGWCFSLLVFSSV